MTKHSDPKTDTLRNRGTLNPHPEQVRDGFFLENDFFDARDLLQVKYEMLRKAQVEGECVTRAAAAFGFKELPAGLKSGKGLTGFGITTEEETGAQEMA